MNEVALLQRSAVITSRFSGAFRMNVYAVTYHRTRDHNYHPPPHARPMGLEILEILEIWAHGKPLHLLGRS